MKKDGSFSFRKRAQSFRYAFQGIVSMIRTEHNAWIHSFALVVSVVLGFLLDISMQEWITLIILIALVLAGEAFNSAIEALADHASDTVHPLIGKAKDLAAGGVLLLASAAFLVGCFIFLPKIFVLIFPK